MNKILEKTGLYELEENIRKEHGRWDEDKYIDYEIVDKLEAKLSQLKHDLKRQADELTKIIEFLENYVLSRRGNEINTTELQEEIKIKIKELKEKRDAYLEGSK